MKQRTFEKDHQSQWEKLEDWLDKLDKRQSMNGHEIAEFPPLYRQVCQQLALARERRYTPHLIERLNRLALRGHQHLYRVPNQLFLHIVQFISRDFPQRVRQESRLVGLSALLFFGSLLIMFASVQLKPDLIYSMMNAGQVLEIEQMYDPTLERWGYNREAESDFLMFGFYIKNNIGIGFQTFAGGILWGIGTIFFLVFNGLFIGCIASHLTHIGYIVPFYSFVVGHSSFELIAIVLAGAAGLKLGLALIAPGRLRRLSALRHAAADSIYLVYGVIVMLLLAAFMEAFWSSNAAIAPYLKYLVGGLLWVGVINYFIWVGRQHK
jgi:uncharacterized membrane protein SpoIIM required for sporulation